MILLKCTLLFTVLVTLNYGQLLQNARFRRFPMQAAMKIKNRLKEKLLQYKERNTQSICYDAVGCFNLPHKNSPLQKVPEDPEMLDTKFFLFTRKTNFSRPEVLFWDDDGKSLRESTFSFKKPLKLVVHGYMSRWNGNISLILANAYLKLYDCNMILMDWHVGARGPQYASAAANTELVGRQLGMLLMSMVDKGLAPRDIHLIGFSLGAHVCGTASESIKVKGHLVGRITGLDAASPLFRNNYLREKYKKLDKTDAKFVDVIHTDSSPFVTDGFGLWQPIGHVDFFPNGGQEQPGCSDVKGSIVVSHFDRSLTREIACSHIRAFYLFTESVLNKLRQTTENRETCEFTAFSCPEGLPSFERGSCFPLLDPQSSLTLDPLYRPDIGRFGEDAKGEGVMFFSTKDSSQYCGTQLQASVQLSPKTKSTKGVLQLQLYYLNYTVNFQIKCEISDNIITGTKINGLFVTNYNSLSRKVDNITARLNYFGSEGSETQNEFPLYIDKITVRDIFGNSWQYCKRATLVHEKTGPHYVNSLNVTLSRLLC